MGKGRIEAFNDGVIASAFINPWIACPLYCLVAAIWFVPDRRIEREIEAEAR
jgi:uncharacterized membrane protein